MPEKYCKDCNRWFNSHEALEQHMKFSSKHLFRCEPCAREFFSKEARVAHWQKNISHLYTYCLRCQVNYATPEELNLHYINGAAHRNTYDARCNIHFANSQDMLRHKQATPATHFLCLPCGLDCATSAELTAHWQDSEIHEGQYDARCDCLFDTSDARIAHENASPKHNVCQQCRLDFQALYLLQEHWRTTEVHKYTYDNFCRVDFATPQLLLSHKKAGEGKHHVCEPCALDHRTIEELKDHLRTAEVHRGSFCSKCETDFDTASKLKVVCLAEEFL